MYIINTDTYASWSKSGIPSETLLISCEYLDDDLISSLVTIFNLTSNINNIKVYILFKGSNDDFCNNYSDINSLLTLKNLSSNEIIIKRNTTLNFTGFLIDTSNLITFDYAKNRTIVDINRSNCPTTISTFKSIFFDLFAISEDIDIFYDTILDCYINNSFNLNNMLVSYIDLIKSNDLDYKSSCLYSTHRDNIKLSASSVPQFSNFENGAYILPKILVENNNPGYSFLEVGKLLLPSGKKDGAYTKYGENHSKLAEILGLVCISSSPKSRLVYISDLGRKFLTLSETEKMLFLKYQIYSIPLMKYLFNICFDNIIDIEEFILDISTLSQSTAKRRSSNVKGLVQFLIEDSDGSIANIWSNCLGKKKLKSNNNSTKYKFTKEEINTIYDIVTNKFLSGIDYINIDSIYKSVKLYEPTLLKINKIDDTNKLFNLISDMLSNTRYIFKYPLITSISTQNQDPFKYFILNNDTINRNEFFKYFSSIGYGVDTIHKKFDEHTKDLIRLDYDTFISKTSFNITLDEITSIKLAILNHVDKYNYLTLFDTSIVYSLPDINYDYNHYLLCSIITHYLYQDFNIIYKYSSKTLKYKYLFLVDKKSNICDFSDLLIYIFDNVYFEFNSINIFDVESYLIVNNIVSTSLCKSFIDDSKIYIDKLNRLKAL